MLAISLQIGNNALAMNSFKGILFENGLPLKGSRTAFIFTICHLLFVGSAFGQKWISLGCGHNDREKDEHIYNMAGAEVYVVIQKDSVFLPKINEYEFRCPREIDSLILQNKTTTLTFFVKTCRSMFFMFIPKEIWKTIDYFTFSFYKTDAHGAFSSFSFQPMMGVEPLIMVPHTGWLREFYLDEGR